MTKESRTQSRRPGGISPRTAAWLAWSLWAVCVVLIALALWLDFLTTEDANVILPPAERLGLSLSVLTGVLSLAFPTVGALIASRLPTNPIGWIFCGVGLLYIAQRFTTAYADYALLVNLAFPGAEYMAWFSTLAEFSGRILAGVFVMLLFPDGRLLSRRWQIVAWTAALGATLIALNDAFYPDFLSIHPYVNNPFGVVGVIGRVTTYDFFAVATLVGKMLLLTSTLAALSSLVLRLRRARGDQRQQLKWFLYAAVPASVCFCFILLQYIVLEIADFFLIGQSLIQSWESWGLFSDEIRTVAVFALLVLPVFTYIAILRHRLYDIDVIINCTLVYGALSACVVLIYMLAVVALGAHFQAQGNLAVSLLATGLVAVLFQPLRSRLQRSVNRLMYRERDDPYAVISRLGRRLEATLAPDTVLPTSRRRS